MPIENRNAHINWNSGAQQWNYEIENGRIKNIYVDIFEMLDRRWNEYINDQDVTPWIILQEEWGIPHRQLTEMRGSQEWRFEVERYLREKSYNPNNSTYLQILGVKRNYSQPTIEPIVTNLMPNRKFGIEIEFGAQYSRDYFASAISEAGIPCRDEDWNRSVRNHWKIIYDSSIHINNYEYQIELISPPLIGVEGLDNVKQVLEVVADIGYAVNKTCGLHCHIDAHNLSFDNVRNIAAAWVGNEWVIDSFIPPSRRRRNNYCQKVPASFHEIDYLSTSISDVRSYCNPNGERNYKMNLQSLNRNNTIEFRYHSGTCSFKKIKRHVQFLIGFVEYYKEHRFVGDNIVDLDDRNDIQKLITSTTALLDDVCIKVEENERDPFKEYWRDRQVELRVGNMLEVEEVETDPFSDIANNAVAVNTQATQLQTAVAHTSSI